MIFSHSIARRLSRRFLRSDERISIEHSKRRVKVLPDHLANQIAAGEVIQRPESVVKELLENSLDAGATEILVVVKEGGKKLIQVADNGMGMDEEDARNAFLRHATSKISTVEDLEAIRTYGFRGEALASIASVAHVTMKTRRAEDDAAVVVHMDGNAGMRVAREGREPGTLISVQNLFFNVPARRKFLKSTPTEFRHISESVQRVALSHPEVAIKFISDDETLLDLRAASLEERLKDVYGERYYSGLVWMEERNDYISVYGYVGKPSFGQRTRANQHLFLNKRHIVNRNIAHAVFSAYENLLEKGTFPFFLLFLDIDPHRVDVNVHPSKLEAKFEDEQNIYRFISTLVRRTLSTNNLIPAMSAGTDDQRTIGLSFTDRQHMWPSTERVDPATGEILPHKEFSDFSFQPIARTTDGIEASRQLFSDEGKLPEQESLGRAGETPTVSRQSPLVWQLHNKYILTPIENGIMIIDQHVAHERILYEWALGRFEKESPPAQQLLFPLTVEMTPGDYALCVELLPHLDKLGFSIKPFGKNTIVIEGVPADIKHVNESTIVQELLDQYKEYSQHGKLDARDTVAKSYSCKAAIKAGDALTPAEMQSLLDQLFATSMPYVCPHGRPVVLKIATDELDRRFGRL